MTSQDIIAASEAGQKYRIDDVCILAGGSEWTGRGSLEVSETKFTLEVVLDADQSEPPMPKGFVGRSEFWEIRGRIEGQLAFLTHGVPAHRSFAIGGKTQITLRIETNLLEIEPTGMDLLTEAQLAVALDSVRAHGAHLLGCEPQQPVNTPIDGVVEAIPDSQAFTKPVKVRITAKLKGYRLAFCDSQTHITEENPFLGESMRWSSDTCHGEVPGWKYGLVQKGGDVDIHFWSTDSHESKGKDEDETLFRAFLGALAFAHGQHAWPMSLHHRRDGKLVLDRIHLDTETNRSSHAPFSRALSYQALTAQRQWKLQDYIEKAYAFFAAESELRDEISRLVYLLREATAGDVAHSIELLAVCSLFESLIRAVYRHRIEPLVLAETQAFNAVKDQVRKKLAEQADAGNRVHYDRLDAILANAEPINIRTKFQAVVEHLALEREYWKKIYEVWTNSRNPATHQITRNDRSEAKDREALVAESQIAGAINRLVLKLMGYSGPVVASAYEDTLTEIAPSHPQGSRMTPRQDGG